MMEEGGGQVQIKLEQQDQEEVEQANVDVDDDDGIEVVGIGDCLNDVQIKVKVLTAQMIILESWITKQFDIQLINKDSCYYKKLTTTTSDDGDEDEEQHTIPSSELNEIIDNLSFCSPSPHKIINNEGPESEHHHHQIVSYGELLIKDEPIEHHHHHNNLDDHDNDLIVFTITDKEEEEEQKYESQFQSCTSTSITKHHFHKELRVNLERIEVPSTSKETQNKIDYNNINGTNGGGSLSIKKEMGEIGEEFVNDDESMIMKTGQPTFVNNKSSSRRGRPRRGRGRGRGRPPKNPKHPEPKRPHSPTNSKLRHPIGRPPKNPAARKRVNCSHCQRSYFSHHDLQVHLKTHVPNRSKPFKCEICQSSFYARNSFVKHLEIHNSNRGRDYKCSACPNSYYDKSKLFYHNYYQHTPEGRAEVTCKICGVVLASTWTLKKHELIHTGEKPFSCSRTGCGKSFVDAGNCRAHQKICCKNNNKKNKKKIKSQNLKTQEQDVVVGPTPQPPQPPELNKSNNINVEAQDHPENRDLLSEQFSNIYYNISKTTNNNNKGLELI